LTIVESSRRCSADGSGWADAEPTYWPARVWGGYAEHLAESLTAGARVVVVGRTGTRAWTMAEGECARQDQRRLEVVAEEVAPSPRWATANLAKVERCDGDAPIADEPPF
jgi:single-strand DNA-binding protein